MEPHLIISYGSLGRVRVAVFATPKQIALMAINAEHKLITTPGDYY
jgi:hypothetical protein